MERKELVAGLIAHEEWAWRQFVEDYARIIYSIGGMLGFSPADREDLLQSTCLTALRSIATLRDPAKLSSWTYSVARRLAIDKLRQKREFPIEDLHGDDRSAALPNPNPLISDELQRLEETARLADAVGKLDDRCRLLLTTLYLQDPRPSYRSIAQSLEIPVGSIGPTRARCLKKLAQIMKRLSKGPPRPST
ncbi:MAG: sigma-70 family RNA polymerase sigma factor [Candidatus Eisenbacteria sp.]|nr:sigma-70 family RNA polymerase sigma factor [Candidatus Eisenbacteria bacterium]